MTKKDRDLWDVTVGYFIGKVVIALEKPFVKKKEREKLMNMAFELIRQSSE